MEKKYYQVFSIDVCDMTYAMDYCLIGAESVDDLLAHWEEIFNEPLSLGEAVASKERITLIEDMFTTTPYKIIDRYSYYE